MRYALPHLLNTGNGLKIKAYYRNAERASEDRELLYLGRYLVNIATRPVAPASGGGGTPGGAGSDAGSGGGGGPGSRGRGWRGGLGEGGQGRSGTNQSLRDHKNWRDEAKGGGRRR